MWKMTALLITQVLTVSVAAPGAWSQTPPKTCTEAYSACAVQKQLAKQCDDERQWCLKTGSFAHPKTKAVSSGLQKQ